MRRFLFWLSAKLPCRMIGINGQPYLERYHLGRVFGVTFYLHRFISGDGDRNVHDHPWRQSAALILAGGYTEERVTWFDPFGWRFKLRDLKPFRLNLISHRAFHRIVKTRPETWTLFMHTSRIKSWGFMELMKDSTPIGTHIKYYQPFDVSGSVGWDKKASKGGDLERIPLWAYQREEVKDAA